MPSRRMSVLGRMAEKENILFYHCILYGTLSVGCSFPLFCQQEMCVDKMDYLFRGCEVAGVTVLTI